MKIYIVTLGCKVNQYESQSMLEDSLKAGFTKANSEEEADIVVVNSCTVTQTSVKKAQKLCRRLKRENPEAILVLCGCMPQVYSENTSLYDDIDIVMGNTNRKALIPDIQSFLKNKEQIIDVHKHNREDKFERIDIKKFDERTRAFIKIEDGCENFCAYCMIPFARGFVRSRSLEDIKSEVELLSKNGFKEIVLTGINLSAYGKDLGLNLCDAVETVSSVEDVHRIRLSSLEPDYLSDDIIERLAKEPKLCPQFHLALQSGCDETLARMNRHYNTKRYMDVVNKLKENFENSSFTTDVMVGFPGETEEEFKKSMDFVKEVGFLKVHVFAYSRREGTVAAIAKNQVPPQLKKQRSKLMIEMTKENTKIFLKSQVGKTLEVLFENRDKDGLYEGFSENYCQVKLETEEELAFKFRKVKITDVKSDSLQGELL